MEKEIEGEKLVERISKEPKAIYIKNKTWVTSLARNRYKS